MQIQQIEMNRISPHVRLACYIETTKEIYYVPWRMIYDYEFNYIVEGEIEVLTEDKSVILGAGDVHIMRPLNWHKRIAKSSHVKYYNIHFDFLKSENFVDFSTYSEYVVPINRHVKRVERNDFLSDRPIFEPIDMYLPLKNTVKEGAKYLILLERIVEHFKNKKPENELLVKADMLVLIAQIMQENRQEVEYKSIKNNPVTQFTQVLSGSYNEKIYIGDLAEQSGMSQAQMRKIFKNVNGISPRDYLIGKRIAEAKVYLEEGTLTVAEIAEKVGYENVNYFSRLFKKRTGMSPTAYRASLYSEKGVKDAEFYWCDVISGGQDKKEKDE